MLPNAPASHNPKDHLSILFSKLGVSTRAEAVALALRKQLLKA